MLQKKTLHCALCHSCGSVNGNPEQADLILNGGYEIYLKIVTEFGTHLRSTKDKLRFLATQLAHLARCIGTQNDPALP